jgi:hypothetical protein
MLKTAILVAALLAPFPARAADRARCPIPVARVNHSMVYDEGRGHLLMFGGVTGQNGTFLRDLWSWDGAAWELSSETGPPVDLPGRVLMSMGPNGEVILFGGTRGNTFLADTWTWDGAQGSRVSVSGPGARSYHVIAYDPARGAVLLFGGSRKSGKTLRDSWEFRGGVWTKLAKCP